jgi:hypothetical protein
MTITTKRIPYGAVWHGAPEGSVLTIAAPRKHGGDMTYPMVCVCAKSESELAMLDAVAAAGDCVASDRDGKLITIKRRNDK